MKKFIGKTLGITALIVLGYLIAPDFMIGPIDDFAVALIGAVADILIIGLKAGMTPKREALK